MIERLAWVIVVVVVVVWAATTVVLPFVIAGYTAPASVGTVMGSLAGGAGAYLFAQHAGRSRRKSDREDPRRRRKLK